MFIVLKPARTKAWYLRRGVHYTLAILIVLIYFSVDYVSKDIHSILGLTAGVLLIIMYILFIKLINKRHMQLRKKILHYINLISLLVIVITGYIRLSISRTEVLLPTPDFFRQFVEYREFIRNAHVVAIDVFLILIFFHVVSAIWKWTSKPRKKLLKTIKK